MTQPQATPQQYAGTFDFYADGRAVLDDLTAKFAGPIWHADADERTRRIAWREVIEHIHARIAEAAR